MLVVDSLLRSAVLSLERGDHEAAERSLRQALARVPEHPGCLATLALCLAEGQRRYLTAERLAVRSIRVAPIEPWGYHALGRINLLGGRREQAFRYLKRANAYCPEDPRINADLQAMGRRRYPVLRALRRDHPLNVLLGRARHFLASGPHIALVATIILITLVSLVTVVHSAAPPVERAPQNEAQVSMARLARVDSLLAAGEAAAAVALTRDLLAATPQQPEIVWRIRERLGVALDRCGQADEAIAQFELALRDAPDAASVHLNLATALVAAGRRGRAFAEFEAAARLDPGNWRARLDYGQILLQYGQRAGASEHLREAARLCGDCPEAERALAMLLLEDQDFTGALPLLERLHARHPEAADFRDNLALARLRTGSAQDAIALLAPFWPVELGVTGKTILLEADRVVGSPDRARELAGASSPPDAAGEARLWSLAAVVCLEQGFLVEALQAADRAIGLDPSDAASRQNRALILERLGRHEEAVAEWERAVGLDRALADDRP